MDYISADGNFGDLDKILARDAARNRRDQILKQAKENNQNRIDKMKKILSEKKLVDNPEK